jgi:AICAR transformylase/IMP cyclohydrolase PurH
MRAAAPRPAILVDDPIPFGDVVLAPQELTGVSPAQLARQMTEHLVVAAPDTHAEALSVLRTSFPHAPLSARVAALMRR